MFLFIIVTYLHDYIMLFKEIGDVRELTSYWLITYLSSIIARYIEESIAKKGRKERSLTQQSIRKDTSPINKKTQDGRRGHKQALYKTG